MTQGKLIAIMAALTICFFGMTKRAEACWDGAAIDTGRVQVYTGTFGTSWTPELARHAALWTARIEALLPENTRVISIHGYVEICQNADENNQRCDEAYDQWDGRSLRDLFDIVAEHFGLDEVQRREARRTRRAPLTVQVAASTDLDVAQEIARRVQERLHDTDPELGGFLEVGGFPAMNDFVYVEPRQTSAGTVVHQVLVGTYVDRTEASSALTRIRIETGLQPFIRHV